MATLAFTAHPLLLPRQSPHIHPFTHTLRCNQTPPPHVAAPDLRQAYKSAKLAYKSAKRAQVHQQQLSELEAVYRQAKANYKASKYAPTLPPQPLTTTQQDFLSSPSQPRTETSDDDTSAVVVCGGRSCKRLGADAVAAMLRVSPPCAKCMNRCGGVGPTVSIGGVPVKVNFRKAVGEALRTASEN